MIDPRIVSGTCLLLIGLVLSAFVIRVWMTHPVNRVFLVGRFVTEDGLKLLLRNLPTAFACGLFAISMGAAKLAYVDQGFEGNPANHPAVFFGTVEASFAVWAAVCVTIVVARLCRKG